MKLSSCSISLRHTVPRPTAYFILYERHEEHDDHLFVVLRVAEASAMVWIHVCAWSDHSSHRRRAGCATTQHACHSEPRVEGALDAWRPELRVTFLAHPETRVLELVPCEMAAVIILCARLSYEGVPRCFLSIRGLQRICGSLCEYVSVGST